MRNAPLPRRSRALAATAAACVLAVSTLAGCSSETPVRGGGGGADTLQVWVYEDSSTKIQEEFVKRFNQASDIQANLVEIPGEGYQDKLDAAMGTGSAPDIFFNWGGGSISEYVHKDLLLDLTPYLEQDQAFRDAFIPTILDEGRVDDYYYGIPMRGVQPVILFYNKDVFDAAGTAPPQSWDEMLGLIDTFQAQGVLPYVVSGGDPWTELMWLEYLLDRIGGAEVFKTIQSGDYSAWGDPAVLEMAESVRELVDSGAFGDNYTSISYTDDTASTLFAKGEAAMHLMGSWEYANQTNNQPNFAESALGWTEFPALPGGAGDPGNVVGNPTNYWSVHSAVTGERREAALEFLKMHATEEYSQALIDNGDVPVTINAESLLDTHETPDYATFQYDMVKEAPNFTLSWDQALPRPERDELMSGIEKLFNGRISPEEFVEDMKAMEQ